MWYCVYLKEWSEGSLENAIKFQCSAIKIKQNKIRISGIVWGHQRRNHFYEENKKRNNQQTEDDLQYSRSK